ncbi:hypothetical protein [Candidatus Poriferisocius sp.]|uniref:hypothetical protein n=1 Tax=Candidatus Poriferisocius sp. TaxID=3101276 RepID=UPI003B0233DD
MLGPMDDTLWHQIPEPFEHAGTSDPRFFDRYWFAVYDPAGQGAMQFTMGSYSNMNVLDGGVVMVRGGTQHNLRASRALRPRLEPDVGPMRVEPTVPLEELRLILAPGAHSMACDLVWRAELAPEVEKPHMERERGRVTQHYQRFNQVGVVDGWISVGGERLGVKSWWGCRDHSWGVRPQMGIPEPVTGPPRRPGEAGTLFYFLFFSTNRRAGHVQIMERGAERVYLTGLIRDRDSPDADCSVTGADLSLEFFAGTRRFSSAEMEVSLDGGRSLRLHSVPLGSAVAMAGLGYSGGWNDGLGLGVYRGEQHIEHETWDISHPADVVPAAGERFTPLHRIAPVAVTTGESGEIGTGSLTLIANGHLPQYGLP